LFIYLQRGGGEGESRGGENPAGYREEAAGRGEASRQEGAGEGQEGRAQGKSSLSVITLFNTYHECSVLLIKILFFDVTNVQCCETQICICESDFRTVAIRQ
jgi:hypothetical protein